MIKKHTKTSFTLIVPALKSSRTDKSTLENHHSLRVLFTFIDMAVCVVSTVSMASKCKNTVFPFLFFEYAPACNAISLKYYLEGWQGHKMLVVLVLLQYMSA